MLGRIRVGRTGTWRPKGVFRVIECLRWKMWTKGIPILFHWCMNLYWGIAVMIRHSSRRPMIPWGYKPISPLDQQKREHGQYSKEWQHLRSVFAVVDHRFLSAYSRLTWIQAAGVIHSDFEKGFIRAETISYEDLSKLGSEKAVKDAGLLRSEGREYVMREGDVVLFRFNV